MIVVESIIIEGNDFTHTYSDLSVYILNEKGEKYAEAYDLVDFPHTYTETDEQIPQPPEDGEGQLM